MKTSNHTPGPWTFDPKSVHGMYWVKGWDNHPIAYVEHQESAVPRCYHDANARLISAAPDLLEALQGIVRQAEIAFIDGGRNGYAEIEKKARTAIAKAIGN